MLKSWGWWGGVGWWWPRRFLTGWGLGLGGLGTKGLFRGSQNDHLTSDFNTREPFLNSHLWAFESKNFFREGFSENFGQIFFLVFLNSKKFKNAKYGNKD